MTAQNLIRLNAHYSLLEQQFSKPVAMEGIIPDGNNEFFNFSTGRRNIESLHSVITLLPRHDALIMLVRFLWSLVDLTVSVEDEIELDFKLQPGSTAPGFVWGAVSKECLKNAKQDRWDLVSLFRVQCVVTPLTPSIQTLTRTTESPLLSGGYCVMSG